MSNKESIKSVKEDAIILKNSLYPAEKISSIEMLVEYCRAIDISPYLQVAHIVSKYIKDKETGQSIEKDTIMPGIGQYRVKADKSGLYAGIKPPKFGPTITKTIEGVTFSYPEYCMMTIKKIVAGKICEFSHTEFWEENYATAGRNTSKPNYMWLKRPFAQLVKCTEMQVTKKAFSADVTQHPTLDELQGKDETIEEDIEENIEQRNEIINKITGEIQKKDMKNNVSIYSLSRTYSFDDLKTAIELFSISTETQNKWLNAANVNSLEELTQAQVQKIVEMLYKKAIV